MQSTQNDTLADVYFSLNWGKNDVKYEDSYFASEVNLWQDYFPDGIRKELINKPEGYQTKKTLLPGGLLPDYDEKLVKTIKLSQLDLDRIPDQNDTPGEGRYYPKGIIRDIGGIYKQNVTPFRFIRKNGITAMVDFNHPLAGIELDLDIEIRRIEKNDRKYGGVSTDWFDLLTTGPGMQNRFQMKPTAFFNENAFNRDDPAPDDIFYRKERMVSHIDDMAQNVLKDLYGRLLNSHSTVLDLMASWQSHLPDELHLKHLDGLGLNQKELSANPRLDDRVVRDLNTHPALPYPDSRFDAVICSLSVEYLTQPFAVFRDVARVLKPGGSFMVTFSNRWFPPKAIDLWKHVHEFERLAVVTEYFLHSGCFADIQTISKRGYPRPYTDKYFPGLKDADPIYMVRGKRI